MRFIPSSYRHPPRPRLVTLVTLGLLALWAFSSPPCGQAETASAAVGEEESAPDTPDVDRLLERFDELYESKGTISVVEIEITRPGKTRALRLRGWTKGRDKALIVVEAPARDAGMATLKVERNLWNYLPKIARTVRVPPSLMMGSWMGSDLTNDDLVRESSYEEDYTSELVGRSTDPDGWLVHLVAKPDLVGLWDSVTIVFSYDELLPVRAQYFDRKGRLSRTMLLGDVKTIGGRRTPTLITIIPEREEGRQTTLRYVEVKFDVEVDDSMFSLSELERRR